MNQGQLWQNDKILVQPVRFKFINNDLQIYLANLNTSWREMDSLNKRLVDSDA